jgi:hypothetical protein
MLSLPTSGFARSVSVDRVSLVELSDWIEASLLFGDDRLGQNEVVDVLCEQGIYVQQDMARGKVSDAWAEIRRRLRCLGMGSSLDFRGTVAKRLVPTWRDSPAYSFCIILSCASLYSSWSGLESGSYVEQGKLFELLCGQAIERHFPGWRVEPTGWSAETSGNKLPKTAARLAISLRENVGDLSKWTTGDENDAELDLVCFKPFSDNRCGIPAFFFQCASGKNWRGKLHTPRMSFWAKILDFCVHDLPCKGLAIPFALSDHDFFRKANLSQGLLLDRYRLLSVPESSPDWIEGELKKYIISWCEPRVDRLIQLSNQI